MSLWGWFCLRHRYKKNIENLYTYKNERMSYYEKGKREKSKK